jgi:hypothetical protein
VAFVHTNEKVLLKRELVAGHPEAVQECSRQLHAAPRDPSYRWTIL